MILRKMAGGLRSFLAFWLGGACTPVVVPPITSDIAHCELNLTFGAIKLDFGESRMTLNNIVPEMTIGINQ